VNTENPAGGKSSCMKVALDVAYRGGRAAAAGVLFTDPEGRERVGVYTVTRDAPRPYMPGRFYLRELPPILKLLEEIPVRVEWFFIDGYVHLAPPLRGLGDRLGDAVGGKKVIIGVAKSPFPQAVETVKVFRGKSRRPVYVSSRNVALEEAARIVAAMDGPYRIPAVLRAAHRAAEEACVEAGGTGAGR